MISRSGDDPLLETCVPARRRRDPDDPSPDLRLKYNGSYLTPLVPSEAGDWVKSVKWKLKFLSPEDFEVPADRPVVHL